MLRHTAAMRLLHAGVDTTVIALWLGHEQAETTQIYLHADLTTQGERRSPGPPRSRRQARPLQATRPPCSPSSKRSDYADPNKPDSPAPRPHPQRTTSA